MALGANRWGKTDVRVSKVLRGGARDDFVDLSVQVLLEGDVEAAHTEGDNSGVVPTDTMRNTVYGLAQEHLGRDLEAFGVVICDHFLDREWIRRAEVTIHEFKIVTEHADQVLLQTHHQRVHPAIEDHICPLPAHLG